MMNQTGQTAMRYALLSLILIGVTALILIPIASIFSKTIGESALSSACSASVSAVHQISQVEVAPKTYKKATCERIVKGELSLSSNKEKAELFLSKSIMDQAESCWKKFGEGELSPYAGERGTFTETVQSHCYVCSSFRIPEGRSVNLDSALEEYIALRPDAAEFVSEAFISKDDKQVFGVKSLDTDKWVWGSGKPTFEAVEPWNLQFEGGKTYYVVNIFFVNKGGTWLSAGLLNDNQITSAIAVIDPTYEGDVCAIMEN